MRIVVVGLLAAVVIAPSVDAATGPRLRIVGRSPLVLRGVGFGGGERVKVSATLGTNVAQKSMRADRTGRFVARFPGLVYDRCHGALKVTAYGARGHRAGFAIEPLPCPTAVDSHPAQRG